MSTSIGAVTHDLASSHVERYGRAALATAGVGAAAVGARALSVGLPCPMLAITGIPCPGCGMTRLADTVAHGQLGHAFSADPAGLVFLLVVGALAATYLLTRALRWHPPLQGVRWVPAVLAVTLGIHWLTTLVTGGMVSA